MCPLRCQRMSKFCEKATQKSLKGKVILWLWVIMTPYKLLVIRKDYCMFSSIYLGLETEGVKHCCCFSGITSADWLPGQDAGPWPCSARDSCGTTSPPLPPTSRITQPTHPPHATVQELANMIYCPGGQVRTRNQFSLHILASLLLFLQALNTISVILDLTLEYE